MWVTFVEDSCPNWSPPPTSSLGLKNTRAYKKIVLLNQIKEQSTAAIAFNNSQLYDLHRVTQMVWQIYLLCATFH